MKKKQFLISSLIPYLPLSLILMGLGIMLWSVYWGADVTKPWQSISILEELGLSKTLTSIPGLSLEVTEPLYYVQQTWLPSSVSVPIWIWNTGGVLLWIIWFGVAYSLLSKGKSYFAIWLAFLAISFYCFHWEIVWQTTSTYLFFWMVLLVGLFSHGLVHDWLPIGKKVGMAIAGFLLVAISLYGAKTIEPLATMWGYGSLWLFGLALWFIAWSAPTVLAAMFALVFQNSEKGKSSWGPLLGIALIYSVNVVWMYAIEVKWVGESSQWIEPIHLWAISLGTGWWFWNQKGKQGAPHHFSILLWLCGAMSVLLLYSWIHLAWLDAWKEVINEWITISFFWMGIAFLIHLVLNFLQPIQAGANIVLIWHQPRRIPWLLPQLGGLVACFVTLSFKNGYTVDQAIAGMYFQQADYHERVGESEVAETLYREGLIHDPNGWKGNYSLAMLARVNQDHVLAATYFQRILQKNVEPAATIGLAQSLEAENLFFDGIFQLQKSIQKNPDPRIMTQLAYLFDKANVRDSAYIYREKAWQLAPNRSVEKVNHLIGYIEQGQLPEASPRMDFKTAGEKANWTALARMHQKPWSFEPDTTLPQGVDRFAWTFNQILSNQGTYWKPTTWETGAPGWELFQRELVFAKAYQEYQQGSKREGLDIMQRILVSTSDTIPTLFVAHYGDWLAKEAVWPRFQQDVLPRLSPEQKIQVVSGQIWEERKENQWKEWKNAAKDPEKTWNQYPFHEKIILDQVDLIAKQGGKEKAYRYLVRALDYYNEPVIWWEKYVELAFQLGLRSYAEEGLQEIKKRNPERYQKVAAQY